MHDNIIEFNFFICLVRVETEQLIRQVKWLDQILIELNKTLKKLSGCVLFPEAAYQGFGDFFGSIMFLSGWLLNGWVVLEFSPWLGFQSKLTFKSWWLESGNDPFHCVVLEALDSKRLPWIFHGSESQHMID